jgi:tRNA_anti-like
MRSIAAGLAVLLTISCHSAPAIPVGNLLAEYERATARTRQKYDGKEISVQGFALTSASLPGDADQGSVWLEENGSTTAGKVGCWFSRGQAPEFSQIHTGQHLTIKGVFNGESGVQLKFCRLVKVE